MVALLAVASFVALAGLVRFGAMTGPGRSLIEAELNGLSLGRYGHLHVEGLDGDVFSDFSVRHLTVLDAQGAWIDLKLLRVRWSPWALLSRRIDAAEIDAGRLSLLRQPVLGPRTPGGASSIGVHVGRLRARIELLPAFSYRYGLYDIDGGFDLRRAGGAAGKITAVSLTHAGDRLDGVFDLGRDKTVKLSLQAHEAEGGAMAGALGLAADQPFFVSASASGTISHGQFQATSRVGGVVPLQGAGAWTPQGGSAQGQVTLAASRWLSGYQKMLGPQASFQIAGVKAADGFFNTDLSVTSANVDIVGHGEADVGRLTTSPKGGAVTITARSIASVLGWPPTKGARLVGTFAGQADRWTLAGDLTLDAPAADGYALAQVRGPVKFVQKNNALTLTADMTGLGGQGSGLLAALLGSRPHGAATLNWLPDGRLLMKSLAVDGPGLKVTGDGQTGLFGGLSFKGEASFSNLAAARAGAKGLIKASWSATQDKGDKPWAFTLDAGASDFISGMGELDRLLGAAPHLKGDATWDGHVAEVGHANLTGAAGDVNAIGRIGGDGALNLKLDWRAKGPFDVGPLEIAGDGKGSGDLTGTLTDPRADLAADFAAINLPSLTLTSAHVTMSFLQGPSDTNGAFTLAAQSPYGPAKADTGFRFASDGIDLTGLNAEAGGLHAEGSISLRSGEPSSSDLTVSVGPGAFLTRGQMAGRLIIVDAPGGAHASLKATASNAATREGGVIIQAANVSAEGPMGAMAYSGEANGYTTHGAWKIAGKGVFAAAGPDYAASFEGSGRVRTADFKTLSPAEVKFGPHGNSISALADVGGGRAQIDARQVGDTLVAKAELTDVGLELLDQDFTGRFDASLSLNGQGQTLAGSLDAKLSGAGEKGLTNQPMVDGTVKAQLAGDQVTLDAQLGNAQGLSSTAHLVLPAEATAAPFRIAIVRNKAMHGEFAAQGEVKPLWDLLMGGERGLAGQIKAQGTLAGTLADPRAEGEATIANGQFSDSETGLKLRGVSMSARLADNAVDVSQFSGQDGSGGTISGSGVISLARAGASNFKLTLNNFRLLDNDVATAAASGQATIDRAADGKVKLAGALTVGRADVAANPPVPSGVTPMDVVEINRQIGVGGRLRQESDHAPAVDLDVTLKAARGIFLKGRGLNLEVSLDAHVTGSTAQPVLAGTANVVRGDYDFAGKRFEFDNRGVIHLATAAEEIRLDLTATWDDPSLTAVINIQGTAAKPTITLTSSPVLPTDEVLSQVLFGSSASQLSPMEGAELASAAASLAGGSGLDVLGDLRSFAHLDRLALGSAAGGPAYYDSSFSSGANNAGAGGFSVSGGKYVTDNVYLELTGGGRTGPSGQVEWRVRKDLSIISTIAGSGGDSQVSVRWRKDY